jgi:hypothetical protein
MLDGCRRGGRRARALSGVIAMLVDRRPVASLKTAIAREQQ